MTIYKIDCIFVIPDCRFLYKNRCKTKFVTFLTEKETLLTSHFSLLTSHFSLLTSQLGMQIILSFGRGSDRKLKRCFLLYYKLCYCSNYLPQHCASYLALSLCNCDFSTKLFCLQAASFVPHIRYWVCSLSPPISPLLDFQTPGFDLGTFLIQVDVK